MYKRYKYKSNINNYSGTLFFKLRLTNIKQIKDMYIIWIVFEDIIWMKGININWI